MGNDTYFAPVTNATFPVRSGISREGSYFGLENKKPMFAKKYEVQERYVSTLWHDLENKYS